jgi:hypothetical protein
MTDHPLSSFAAYRKAWESVRPLRDEEDRRFMEHCWQNRSPAPNERFITGPPEPTRPADDEPLRLEDVVRWCPPGITVSTLRNEINNGKLPRCEFGGKLWLTLADIHHAMTKDTRDTCASNADAAPRVRGSIAENQPGQASNRSMSSSTSGQTDADATLALAKLDMTLRRLRKPSTSTSPQSTSQDSATVVPIKS